MVTIDYDKCCWKDGKCISCGCGGECNGCVEVCPTGALERQKIVIFHPDKCEDISSTDEFLFLTIFRMNRIGYTEDHFLFSILYQLF